MSDESDNTLQVERSASLVNLTKKLTTVADRRCLSFPTKINKPDFVIIMQNAEEHPEFINETPPSKPGFGACEVFVMNKKVKKPDLHHDDYTPWHKGGPKKSLEWQHSYFYLLNAHGDFEAVNKASATHVLRICVFVLASCHALTKKIFRMLKMNSPNEHFLPSALSY